MLAERLHNVKALRAGNYAAGCPCCQSKRGRPLSVRALDDGRVLLHPFCGCTTEDVLAAIGLSLGDLFEKPLAHHLAPVRNRVPASDRLELIDHEVLVASLILQDVLHEKTLDTDQWSRLAQAAARIGGAHDQSRT